jgi:hypothetical protein
MIDATWPAEETQVRINSRAKPDTNQRANQLTDLILPIAYKEMLSIH